MDNSGGSAALKGFVYQFLHTLMTTMDECAQVRVRPSQVTGYEDELLVQVEGHEDLGVRTLQTTRLYQLKDRQPFGPADFAAEVLPRFAREYYDLGDRNPEFILFCSAELQGDFWGPFRTLCGAIRQKGCASTLSDLSEDTFTDLGTSPIRIPVAAAWASERDQNGNAKRRGLPSTDSIPDFLSWLLQCLLVTEADISDAAAIVDFLGRVRIDDGHAWEDHRGEVVARLQERLPVGKATERLDGAIGRLTSIAVTRGGQWLDAHVLLHELQVPIQPVSWGAVHRGGLHTLKDTRLSLCDERGSSEDSRELLDYFRLWLELQESPLFIMAGHAINDRLLEGLLAEAARVAPAVSVDCSSGDGTISGEILEQAGWEEPDTTHWPLPALLERLKKDRPSNRPTMVLLVSGFSGTELQIDRLSRWTSLIAATGGLVLLATQEATLRRLPTSTADRWAALAWQAVPPRSPRRSPAPPVSYRLKWEPVDVGAGRRTVENELVDKVRYIAGTCNCTSVTVMTDLNRVAEVACAQAPGSGVAPREELADLADWQWSSTAPGDMPQAAIDAGILYRSGDKVGLTRTPVAALLVYQHIEAMNSSERTELSDRLARTVLASDVVLEGFLEWLQDLAQRPDSRVELTDVLRPWAEKSCWDWTSYVFEHTGRSALPSLRVFAEELASESASGGTDLYRLEVRLRRLFGYFEATGADDLTDWVLEWADDTGSDWLRQQIVQYFMPRAGAAGLKMLLDELRATSGTVTEDSSELTNEEFRLVTAISNMGSEAVEPVLQRLSKDSADAVPLMIALGEIGCRSACPRLEEVAGETEADDAVGQTARKALTLCGSARAREFALDALGSGVEEAVEIGFWMVEHGHLSDMHEEVAFAARDLTEHDSLDGSGFLRAAHATRADATEQGWRALHEACRQIMAGQHSTWLYRDLIRSGLPQAGPLLLDLVLRLWARCGEPVNSITRALWALAEQPLTERQVAEIDEWLRDADIDALTEALTVVSAEDGHGHSLEVALRLQVPKLEELMGSVLSDPSTCWRAGDLVRLVPSAASPDALLEGALQQDSNRGLSSRCAQALAAHGTKAAFDTLVTVMRTWDVLGQHVAFPFASAAFTQGHIAECMKWLLDRQEHKCLRQGSALAVGLALHHGSDVEDSDLIAALETAITESELAYSVGEAASMAQAVALLPTLKDAVINEKPAAFQAAFAIANLGTDAALAFLREMCQERGASFLGGAPAEALAKVYRDKFTPVEDRHGSEWKCAQAWLIEIYGGLRSAGLEDVGSQVVVSEALLRCAVDWRISELTPTVEAEVIDNAMVGWFSSADTHLRWLLLAHHRPSRLLEIAHSYPAQEVSDSNKAPLARALMEIPNQTNEVRDIVLSIAVNAKSLSRREIALEIARAQPCWVGEIAVCAENGPLLRDIATFAEDNLAQVIIGQLTSASTREVRDFGYAAAEARHAQKAASRLLDVFMTDDNPGRRLWWVSAITALADEKTVEELRQLSFPVPDLPREFAVSQMVRDVRKRIKREADDEDRDARRGRRAWLWD